MFSQNANFELQIRPRGRRAADEYYHQGNWFIEGREGNNYTLWFSNRTNHRVMTIFSVDGLDVCNGKPAGPNSDGYIIDAQSSIEIPGWKLDNQTAAEFYFSGIGKSYANASGANTNNVGVIGAMVFGERVNYAALYNNLAYSGGYSSAGVTCSSWTGNSLSPSGHAGVGLNTVGMNQIQCATRGMSAAPVAQNVGTGFGDATKFTTTMVNFERADPTVPDALMVLYYNSAKNLQKMGIQLKTKSNRYDSSTAQAFPGYTTGCTPPPGWHK